MTIRRYLDVIDTDPARCLHTPEAMVEYLECPMYWAFNNVYQEQPKQMGIGEEWARLILLFAKEALEKQKLTYRFPDQIRDEWGEFFVQTHLYKNSSQEVRDKALSEGAQVLENVFSSVFEPEISDANVDTFVYVNPGIKEDGGVRFNVTAVFRNPVRALYITDKKLPIKRTDILNDPRLYSLAVVNRRMQREMGISLKNTHPPEIFSIPEGQVRQVPTDPGKYFAGPHWTRILECMDLIGVYPRVGIACKTCRFQPICQIHKADVRQMKSSGPNKNVDRSRILQRKETIRGEAGEQQDKTGSEQANDPDML